MKRFFTAEAFNKAYSPPRTEQWRKMRELGISSKAMATCVGVPYSQFYSIINGLYTGKERIERVLNQVDEVLKRIKENGANENLKDF